MHLSINEIIDNLHLFFLSFPSGTPIECMLSLLHLSIFLLFFFQPLIPLNQNFRSLIFVVAFFSCSFLVDFLTNKQCLDFYSFQLLAEIFIFVLYLQDCHRYHFAIVFYERTKRVFLVSDLTECTLRNKNHIT